MGASAMSTRPHAMRLLFAAAVLAVSAPAGLSVAHAQTTVPASAEVDFYRSNIEPLLMRGRGGTEPGYAACVMCHTWQTKLRFALETPATPAGWTPEQSRRNFEMLTRLVNTASPEDSRLLLKPLAASAGGLGHTGGAFWRSRDDPEYQAILKWIRNFPSNRFVPAPQPPLDFAFFRSCVQRVFATPREGHLRCSNCHGAAAVAEIAFAPLPGDGRTEWNDEEAKRAFQVISRLIIPGNPEQSRFLLKPLHPDGGGSYAHNGVRRWQSRDDPEWQMLAGWVRGERTGNTCS
jgi:hypothetical protein